jgi:hypothetical protein
MQSTGKLSVIRATEKHCQEMRGGQGCNLLLAASGITASGVFLSHSGLERDGLTGPSHLDSIHSDGVISTVAQGTRVNKIKIGYILCKRMVTPMESGIVLPHAPALPQGALCLPLLPVDAPPSHRFPATECSKTHAEPKTSWLELRGEALIRYCTYRIGDG